MMFYFELNRIAPHKDTLEVTNLETGQKMVFSQVSSYPDYPQGIGILNEKMPDPTVENGIYLLKETLQKIENVQWRVLELTNLDGSQEVPVWRMTGRSTSAGINIHFNRDDKLHLTFVWSAGCITMPIETFKRFRDFIGMTKDDYSKGRILGVLRIQGKPNFPDPYEGADVF